MMDSTVFFPNFDGLTGRRVNVVMPKLPEFSFPSVPLVQVPGIQFITSRRNDQEWAEDESIDEVWVEKIIVPALKDSVLEVGFFGPLDRAIEEVIRQGGTKALVALSAVFLKYLHRPTFSAQIMHAVSRVDFEVVDPIGPTMAAAAIASADIEVKEAGIRAFEQWGNGKYADALASMEVSQEWLSDYRDAVVRELRA